MRVRSDRKGRQTRRREVAVPAGLALLLLLTVVGCSVLGPSEGGFRTFTMGFTPFPHANSEFAVAEAWSVIERDADLAVLHFDGGVPWQEALDGTGYPPGIQDQLSWQANRIPLGHWVYVAVTPLSSRRNGLAGYWDDLGVDQPLPPPWDTYDFDAPEVTAAFTAFCEDMIEQFEPDYFAYAIEANMLNWTSPEQWDAFLALCANVYYSLKSSYPTLPVFATFQVETYYRDPWEQEDAIWDLVPYTDVMALSTYPFVRPMSDPTLLEYDYFSQISDLAPSLPFAIAETCWPAEDVGEPYHGDIPASEATQQAYVERLIEECDYENAAFLCWFFTRDYDDFWDTDFQYEPDAASYRLWRDTGLYDGDGIERTGLGVWRQALVVPR